jgi:hypothetical protein
MRGVGASYQNSNSCPAVQRGKAKGDDGKRWRRRIRAGRAGGTAQGVPAMNYRFLTPALGEIREAAEFHKKGI